MLDIDEMSTKEISSYTILLPSLTILENSNEVGKNH